MIDEERPTDRRARVQIDPGLLVGQLGHHARHDHRALAQERMGDAIHRDRVEARIAHDDLVEPGGRGVALERRADVGREHVAQRRQLRQERGDDALGAAGAVGAVVVEVAGEALGPVIERAVHLPAQGDLELVDPLAHQLAQLVGSQPGRATGEAREQERATLVDRAGDLGRRRQLRAGQVEVTAVVLVAFDQAIGQLVDVEVAASAHRRGCSTLLKSVSRRQRPPRSASAPARR